MIYSKYNPPHIFLQYGQRHANNARRMLGHQSDTSLDLGGLWSKCTSGLLSVRKLYEKNKAVNWCTYSSHGLWSCFVLLIRLKAEDRKDSRFAIGVEKFIGLHFTQTERSYIIPTVPARIHHRPSKVTVYCGFDYLNTKKGLTGIHNFWVTYFHGGRESHIGWLPTSHQRAEREMYWPRCQVRHLQGSGPFKICEGGLECRVVEIPYSRASRSASSILVLTASYTWTVVAGRVVARDKSCASCCFRMRSAPKNSFLIWD